MSKKKTKFYDPEKVYDVSKDEAMRITGWSAATLHRKMTNAVITHDTVPGKTKPTPVFNREELEAIAGIYTGVAEPSEQSEGTLEVLDKSVIAAIDASQKNISKSSQEMVKTNRNEIILRETIQDALLLPFEKVLTLKQAVIESGLPKSIIKKAVDEGKIKSKPRKKGMFKGKEVFQGRIELSLISLKKFTSDYFSG